MNLLLTDHLTCPRCQDGGGLILLAGRVDGRRVLEGQLGCPGCSTKYPVTNGVAIFGESGRPGSGSHAAADPARVAALLGVTEGPAMILLIGQHEPVAGEIAALLHDVEIVVASHNSGTAHVETGGVSALRVADRLPLRDRSMRGALVGGEDASLIAEAVRVIGLAARLVLVGATPEARAALRAQAVHVVAEQDDTLVAVRHS